MSLSSFRASQSVRHLIVLLILLIGVACAANAQTSTTKKTVPAKPAAKPAAAAAKPGAVTASHVATTGARTTMTTTSRTTTTAAHTVGSPAGRAPVGSHEVRTANGSVVRTRANGSRADVHDARRGMDIHHGLNGNRRISVERADHSRVFAERGGRSYVQHPYMYHGHEFGHRTYYENGRYYDRYYNRYGYRGAYLDVYAPGRYYAPGFYGWAYNPWAAPIAYSWGWGGSPWYGYYGGYFAPYPVYPSAAFWLTDYLIATSLQAAYAAQAANAQQAAIAANGPPVLSPDVKSLVSVEVQRQVALENSEAQANAQGQEIDPASSGIARMLSDNQAHVFVAGSDLDLIDAAGQECAISQGDILEVTSAPPADAPGATAIVLASKGGNECVKSDNVTVAFNDLQDMQNHMRETIDQGMGDLQSKQGQGGLPPAPPSAQAAPVQAAVAAAAPPPDTNAAAEIAQQTQAADQAEQEVASAAPAPVPADAAAAPIAPPPAAPPTIALGQTMAEVTAGVGAPLRIIDLGAKKIYVYKDMKVTFNAGKVTDVQ